MYFKIIIAIAFCYFVSRKVHVQGCKVYCEGCPSEVEFSKYYCCMEDWDKQPKVRKCADSSTHTPTIPSVDPSTGSAGPEATTDSTEPVTTTDSTAPVTTPSTEGTTVTCANLPTSRCVDTGHLSEEECKANMRIFPSPTPCISLNDCRFSPFTECCVDHCYKTKICKTYQESTTVPSVPSTL